MQTVTYMLEGAFRHADNKGHEGVVTAGALQWMTAGRGIVHSEMPETDGDNVGLQLWVNLAAKDKMTKPDYQGTFTFAFSLLLCQSPSSEAISIFPETSTLTPTCTL